MTITGTNGDQIPVLVPNEKSYPCFLSMDQHLLYSDPDPVFQPIMVPDSVIEVDMTKYLYQEPWCAYQQSTLHSARCLGTRVAQGQSVLFLQLHVKLFINSGYYSLVFHVN
jgi:hypothetical protein